MRDLQTLIALARSTPEFQSHQDHIDHTKFSPVAPDFVLSIANNIVPIPEAVNGTAG